MKSPRLTNTSGNTYSTGCKTVSYLSLSLGVFGITACASVRAAVLPQQAVPALASAPASVEPGKDQNPANLAASAAAHASTTASASSSAAAASSTSAVPANVAGSAQQHPAPAVAAIPQQTSPGEVALLKIEIMSLKEKVATLQRKFDVILKGQRSGLYDTNIDPTTLSQFQNPKSKKNPVPPLTSEGPIDRFENDDSASQRENALAIEKPQQLVDRAIVLLEQREFGRVAQALENFQQRFPNHSLSAVAELTLAEAYVELKSPQQALSHVRTFYLQHPNDAQLLRAKWLEGRSQELLEAPQKAAQLFREVIALDPQSQLALRARAALEKISGGLAQ